MRRCKRVTPVALDPQPVTQAERLEAALAKRGYSVREFAKMLAGPGATKERWESERRNLQRWLAGQPMFPKSARKVAAAFGEPAEDWVIPRRARAQDEQYAQLDQRIGVLEEQIQGLIAQLSEPPTEQRGPAEELDVHRATPG